MQPPTPELEAHQHRVCSRPEQTAVPALQKGKHCVGGNSKCLWEKGCCDKRVRASSDVGL